MLKKYKWLLIISSIVILLPTVFGIIVWKQLPEQMAIHWGLAGEADGWATTAVSVFLLPSILLVLHWGCFFLSLLDKKSRQQNANALKIVLWIIPVISVYANAVIYATAFGLKFNIFKIMALIFGVLFVCIGNYLPKFSRNRTAGIKIYWTLRSDDNWNKTHRFGGKIWVIGGLLLMICFFLPETVMYYAMAAIIVGILVAPIIYSYCYYRKQMKTGEIAREKFKWTLLLPFVLLIVVVVIAIVFCFSGKIEYTLSDEELVIDPTYEGEISVKYEDIEGIEYREGGVDGKRIIGVGSMKLLLGTFNNEEFGNYARYTYYGYKDCILLTVKGQKLVVGCEDNESTVELYESLLEKCRLGASE